MDAETLADGLRLAQAATPGPWDPVTTGTRGGDHWHVCADGEALLHIAANDGVNEEQRGPDATAIAWFGTHGRELIEALQRVEKLCDEAEAARGWIRSTDVYGNPFDTLVGVPAVRAALRGEEQ